GEVIVTDHGRPRYVLKTYGPPEPSRRQPPRGRVPRRPDRPRSRWCRTRPSRDQSEDSPRTGAPHTHAAGFRDGVLPELPMDGETNVFTRGQTALAGGALDEPLGLARKADGQGLSHACKNRSHTAKGRPERAMTDVVCTTPFWRRC